MPELAERWHAEQTGKVLEYLGGTAVDLVSDHTRTGWFMPDLVDQLNLAPFYRAHRDDGHGHPAHDPTLSLGVLLYGYCLGCAIHQPVVRCCPANTQRIGAGSDRLLRVFGHSIKGFLPAPSRPACRYGCASQLAFRGDGAACVVGSRTHIRFLLQ